MLPRGDSTHVLAATPTGQNRLSICFTYCALILYSSYLTLISSYQSQPLAVKVPRQPQVPLPDGESLMQQRKECSGGCAVMKVNYKLGGGEGRSYDCRYALTGMMGDAGMQTLGVEGQQTHCDSEAAGKRWVWGSDSSSMSSAKLAFLRRASWECTSRRPGVLLTAWTHTYRHRTFSLALD